MSYISGWHRWEQPQQCYEIGTDDQVVYPGSKRSGFVRCVKPELAQFGAIMQKIHATDYIEKRIRFSAYLKCKNVLKSCGLFMEVYETNDNYTSDYMENRKIEGSSDWVKCELVLDVFKEAVGINIGARLRGSGQLWVSDLSFEEVGRDVPVTNENRTLYHRSPQNLDFSE